MAHLWNKSEHILSGDNRPVEEDRLIMLCDGIFAIAMTLLVLDIRLPDAPDQVQGNLPGLSIFLGKILFYFITFLITAGYWLLHRRIMRQVRRLDMNFIWLTFLFLAFVVLVPASITVVSEYGDNPQADLIYTLSLVACGFSGALLWIYACWKHRLVDPELDREIILFTALSTLVNPVYFLLSLLLLFIPPFSNDASLIYYSWIFLFIPNGIIGRIQRHRLAIREHLHDSPPPEQRVLHDPEPEPTREAPSAPLTDGDADQAEQQAVSKNEESSPKR